MSTSDRVLVVRLTSCLPDPFKILNVSRTTDFDKVRPRVRYVEDHYSALKCKRNEAYSMGRIRYFRDLFLSGKPVPPLEVDNRYSGSSPWGLALSDGHHRLCGAILARSEYVDVSYSGVVEGLYWLRDEDKPRPEWL